MRTTICAIQRSVDKRFAVVSTVVSMFPCCCCHVLCSWRASSYKFVSSFPSQFQQFCVFVRQKTPHFTFVTLYANGKYVCNAMTSDTFTSLYHNVCMSKCVHPVVDLIIANYTRYILTLFAPYTAAAAAASITTKLRKQCGLFVKSLECILSSTKIVAAK